MGRIRSIKPELPKDELLGTLSRDVRLLFILLLTLADDDGRFRASSALIRAELFPYDEDLSQHEVNDWLNSLETAKRIRTYAANGQRYAEIVNFKRHQRIQRPLASRIPPPPPNFTHAHGGLTEESVTNNGGRGGGSGSGSGSGEEGERGSFSNEPKLTLFAEPSVEATPSPAAVLRLWNETVHGRLPEIREITPGRRKTLKARARPDRGLGWFGDLFKQAVASPFLRGETGNRANWKATFDFVLRSEDTVTKILEGGYGTDADANSPRSAEAFDPYEAVPPRKPVAGDPL